LQIVKMAEKSIKIEVVCDSVSSAKAAKAGGADRIELCANLFEGGTTPSFGTIALTRKAIPDIDLFVMIRPRAGDFCYSTDEFEVIKHDIVSAKQLQVNGVVFGILKEDGNVDINRCKYLINLARPLKITFHRAFDMTKDSFQALEEIIDLGFERILTSGQEKSVFEGIDLIAGLIKKANNRIIIMPGGGITEKNISKIIQYLGNVKEIHVSGRVPQESKMTYRNMNCFMGGELHPNEFIVQRVDEGKIKNFISLANAPPANTGAPGLQNVPETVQTMPASIESTTSSSSPPS